jgi:hypothetical protein
LSGFALLLGTGRFRRGPIVLVLSQSHGLHAGDLLVIGFWVLAVSALVWLAMPSHRDPTAPRERPRAAAVTTSEGVPDRT